MPAPAQRVRVEVHNPSEGGTVVATEGGRVGVRSDLEIGILGPLEVHAGGEPVALPQGKPRMVLALLVLHANEVVANDRLIDEVWGEKAPATAANALHVYISQLRSCLGTDAIVTRAPGYLLEIDSEQLDTGRVERLCEEAAQSDPATAAATLRDCLALWRGAPLSDFSYDTFAQDAIAELDELHLATLEQRIDADLSLGRHAELVAELTTLTREQPLRDHLRGALMLALYRSGRQADALAVYADGRRLLDEQYGLEPGPELKDLQHKILDHDPSLQVAANAPHGSISLSGSARGSALAGRRRLAVLLAGVILVCAVLVVAAYVTTERPGSANASAQLPSNSLGVLSTSGHVTADVPVQASPGPLALGAGAVWVANVDNDSVSRIDPTTKSVVQTIPVGKEPSAIAVGGGFVWVANALDGTVWQISPLTNQSVRRYHVGNEPSGIALGEHAVWVANSGDSTLTRIDPRTGKRRTIPVAAGADRVAAGDGAVWVTSGATGIISQLDPSTGNLINAVQTSSSVGAIAAGTSGVWVASSEADTVSRIDPVTDQIRPTILVGTGPNGIAVRGNDVWVSNEQSGTLSRIDATLGRVVMTVATDNRPEGVALDANAAYVAVRGAGVSHRGGTLHVAIGLSFTNNQHEFLWLDPAYGASVPESYDGLTTYRHVAGSEGLQLVPDLALSLPTPSNGGKTYTFRLRPGLHYSNGALLRPADIRRGIQRALETTSYWSGSPYFLSIAGSDRCQHGPCDLKNGITTDASANTITFHLSAPDPDFLYKLTVPAAVAVPATTPLNAQLPLPATGPYKVASFSLATHTIILVRNPYFHEWSAAAQPAGYPDRIVTHFNKPDNVQLHAVERGAADFFNVSPRTSTSALHTLQTRYANQLHDNPTLGTEFFTLPMAMPPFNDVRVRRAINYAWDRNHGIALMGGKLLGQPTCQVLPPNLPGYRRYCPYTIQPRADGSYTGPDLAKARRLVAASGTKGRRVVVWYLPNGISHLVAPYLVSVLKSLGYKAQAEIIDTQSKTAGAEGLLPFGWGTDYASAFTFFDPLLKCETWPTGWHFCLKGIDAQIAHADSLQTTNPQAAEALWARIDHEIVDQAPWLYEGNPTNLDVVSRRVGNYQYNPQMGALLDQLWIR